MITIYSKENCPACLEAVKVCAAAGKEYNVLKLDVDYTKEALLEKCPVPVRSVPQLFIDGDVYIGGLPELKQLFQ